MEIIESTDMEQVFCGLSSPKNGTVFAGETCHHKRLWSPLKLKLCGVLSSDVD